MQCCLSSCLQLITQIRLRHRQTGRPACTLATGEGELLNHTRVSSTAQFCIQNGRS